MTETEAIVRVRDRLDETDSTVSSQRYPDATAQNYLYAGARFYVARTGCQYATTTITQDPNVLLYDLPCDCIQVERVLWSSGGTYYPLDATLARDLDEDTLWWQRSTDTRARGYFLFGLRKIALWPVSPDGGEDYIVHYQQDVYDSIAAVPVEDHECLVDYVVARFLLAEGKVAEGVERMTAYRKVVEQATKRFSSLDRKFGMSVTL